METLSSIAMITFSCHDGPTMNAIGSSSGAGKAVNTCSSGYNSVKWLYGSDGIKSYTPQCDDFGKVSRVGNTAPTEFIYCPGT